MTNEMYGTVNRRTLRHELNVKLETPSLFSAPQKNNINNMSAVIGLNKLAETCC